MGRPRNKSIGKTFNNGKLLVVGNDEGGYVKVKCNVCVKDTELFGDGVFKITYAELKKGTLPCGCSKRVKWTLTQYQIKIERKITEENLPIKFIGFGASKAKTSLTPVKLFCSRLGVEYEVSTISNFLRGTGNQGEVQSALESIARYNLDNPNYTVWEILKKGKSGGNTVCGFHCKICDDNGFESLFETHKSSLFRGEIPCYCSGRKMNISGNHIFEMTKKKLSEEGLRGVSVIGVYRFGTSWKSVFLCDIHGVYSREYHDLSRNTGCYCLKCTPPLYGYNKIKQGYLYLLEIQEDSHTLLGYGITNKLNSRITVHKRNLKSIGATITNMQVFEGSGTAVLAVENAIKSLHTTGLLDCEGFRRESISIDRKEEVLELCKKLKQLDNVDKLI